jgi:hypothetical protein
MVNSVRGSTRAFFAFYQMSSTLRFLGFGAAVTGVILCNLALVSAVILPIGTVESRKGLGDFIQASLLLTATGVAAGSIGTAIKTN